MYQFAKSFWQTFILHCIVSIYYVCMFAQTAVSMKCSKGNYIPKSFFIHSTVPEVCTVDVHLTTQYIRTNNMS